MLKPFLTMIAAGALIGIAWPSGKPAPARPAVESAAGEAPATQLERAANGHFYVFAKVNGELVHFLVDTGASTVALTLDDARRVGIDADPAGFEVIGEGASGPVRGKLVTLDSVDIEGKSVRNVRAAVLEGSNLSLLGQSYLERMGTVEIRGAYMVLR